MKMKFLFILTLFLFDIAAAQDQEIIYDQEMRIYSSNESRHKQVLYVSSLNESEVAEILLLISIFTDDRIKSISTDPALYDENLLQISTCSGYEIIFDRSTCVSGQLFRLQKNTFDEWVLAPEQPRTWGN